jgi:hypothetical protein
MNSTPTTTNKTFRVFSRFTVTSCLIPRHGCDAIIGILPTFRRKCSERADGIEAKLSMVNRGLKFQFPQRLKPAFLRI